MIQKYNLQPCLIAALVITLLMPVTLFAQDASKAVDVFTPLVGVPGVNVGSAGDISDYIQAFFALSITIAAFLAVIKIILAGVQYMFSEIVTSKEKAKKDIFGALFGLLIIVASVLILNTINPALTQFDIFRKAKPFSESIVERTNTNSAAFVSPAPGYQITDYANPADRNDVLTNDIRADAIADCQKGGGRVVKINGSSRCVTTEELENAKDLVRGGTYSGNLDQSGAQEFIKNCRAYSLNPVRTIETQPNGQKKYVLKCT